MTYRPTSVVADSAVRDELQRISRAFLQGEARRLPVLAVAPERPRAGDIAIADGDNWNPLGDGASQPVWFDGVDWLPLGGGGGAGIGIDGGAPGTAYPGGGVDGGSP